MLVCNNSTVMKHNYVNITWTNIHWTSSTIYANNSKQKQWCRLKQRNASTVSTEADQHAGSLDRRSKHRIPVKICTATHPTARVYFCNYNTFRTITQNNTTLLSPKPSLDISVRNFSARTVFHPWREGILIMQTQFLVFMCLLGINLSSSSNLHKIHWYNSVK